MDIGLGDDRKVGKGGSLSVDECQGQRLWRRRNEQRVSTIHQDTIKFSSSAVQIRAIIERFFLEASVFILLDSTLENFFFPSKVAACRYHIGVKSCDDESLDSFINEMSAQLPKKGSVVGPPKVR